MARPPHSSHWGCEDPATAAGTDDEKRRAFDRVFRLLRHRIRLFLDLPLATLDRGAIKRELVKIGNAPLME